MDEVVAVSVGQHQRLAGVLEYALTAAPHTVCTLDTLPPLTGRRVLFAVSLGPDGLDEDFCRLLRLLRSGALSLDGSMGAVLMDGEGEFYTKQAAQMLVLAANGAGCLFPGKPLVEATGSLRNFDIQCRRRGTDRLHAYRAMARELVERLASFVPPVYDRPRVLTLHASDRKTSNTLALGGQIETRLASRCDCTELSLRNGTVHDCRGCSYTVCSHYAQQNSCFYGGSMVDQVYPAVTECNALLLLCPNYNDSVSANIMAFINRLTSLQLFHPLHHTYLWAVVVSGYSGGDLVAQQVLGALCLNKGLILPPRFLLAQTANDPGSALADPEMLTRLDGYAANMLRTMSPDAPKN